MISIDLIIGMMCGYIIGTILNAITCDYLLKRLVKGLKSIEEHQPPKLDWDTWNCRCNTDFSNNDELTVKQLIDELVSVNPNAKISLMQDYDNGYRIQPLEKVEETHRKVILKGKGLD